MPTTATRRRTANRYRLTHECAHCGVLYTLSAAQATWLRCNFPSLRLIGHTRR